MTINNAIGIRGWNNYSSFQLLSASSQRADRSHSLSVNTFFGNLSAMATDILLAGRIPPSVDRAYNHLDDTGGVVPRPFGDRWTMNLEVSLFSLDNDVPVVPSPTSDVNYKDASGAEYKFTYSSGIWSAPAGLIDFALTYDSGNSQWNLVVKPTRTKFVFNADGRLLEIRNKDYENVKLLVNRDGSNKITTVQIGYSDAGTPKTHTVLEFTYVSGTTRVEQIKLSDTLSSSNFTYYQYEYDGNDMLSAVKAYNGTGTPANDTNLNLTFSYTYSGKVLTAVKDSNSNSTSITYTSDKVTKVTQPTYETGTTDTSFEYNVTSGLPFTKLDNNDQVTKVTDGKGSYWWYEQDTTCRIVRIADPLYNSSTCVNDTQFVWNNDNQITEVKTPKPGSWSGSDSTKVSTKLFYNANKKLEVIQDQLGYLSFLAYDAYGNLNTSYSQKPGQIITGYTVPSNPTLSLVKDDDGYYYYDASGTPQKVYLVKSSMTYNAANDMLTSVDPLGNTTTNTYDQYNGDRLTMKTPRQTVDANLGCTTFEYNLIYGVLTSVTNADSKKTSNTYNVTFTRVEKITQPITTCYTVFVYNNQNYLTDIKIPGSPDVTTNSFTYDYNGNQLTESKLNPNDAGGSFTAVENVYDKQNRLYKSRTQVDLQDKQGLRYLETFYEFDSNGNSTAVAGPFDASSAIITGQTVRSVTTYDNVNRVNKSYDPYSLDSKTYTYGDTGTQYGVTPTGVYFTEYSLDRTGNALTITDRRGNATTLTYDDMSRELTVANTALVPSTSDPTQMTNQAITTSTTYDTAGLVYKQTNALSKDTFYLYDDTGRQTSTVLLDRSTGDRNLTEYDANGNVLKSYGYEGYSAYPQYFTENEYDKLDRLINSQRKDAKGTVIIPENTADTEFTDNGQVYKTYDKVNTGKYTMYEYDTLNHVVKISYPEVTVGGKATVYTTQNLYDSAGNKKEVIDQNGNSYTYTFDQLGRTITSTKPGSITTTYYYNERGFNWKTLNPNSSYTENYYNALGQVTETRSYHDSTYEATTYTYDANGNTTQVDYANGGRTNYTYDEVNRLYKTVVKIDSSNNATTYQTFNSNSNLVKSWNALGKATTYEYNDLGQMTSVTNPNNDKSSYTYNKNGATVTTTDPQLLVTTNNYNTAGRVASVVHAISDSISDNITVSYEYDANGQTTKMTDALSNAWTYTYDALGRNVTVVTPAVGGTSYTSTKEFDGNGNVTKVTDFKGVSTSYTYNERNQRTVVTYADATTVTYTWTCCRISKIVDLVGTTNMSYDGLHRLTSITDANSEQVQYTYDTLGRIFEVTDHTSAVTRYTYDLRGGMTKVTADYGTGNAKETTYTLNANGATTKQTLPSAHYNEFTYDDGGRVTAQTFKDSRGKVVESYSYDYAPSGLPSYTYGYTRTENNGDVFTFVNDRMGRLKQEKKIDSSSTTLYQQDFTYDKNGNRLTMQQSGSGSGISSYSYAYTYDAQGKLTYIKDVARYYTGTITTDANGNITSVNEAWTGTANTWKTDFTFDYENRLTKTQISGTAGGKTYVFNTISHAYDGRNRLIKTTAGSNFGHVYDGNKLAGNVNLTNSTNGTAWVNTENNVKQPLASTQIQTVGVTRYYNVSDERDPVRQVYTDAGTAGDTSQKSRYSEYKLIDGSAPTMVTYGGAIKQSELFRVRNITLNENSIVLPSANGSFEAAAISLNYEGTRVKSALIGRDLNPMGRGDGVYYFAGAMKIGAVARSLIYSLGQNGTGNSINNACQKGNRGGGSSGGSTGQREYPPVGPTDSKQCKGKPGSESLESRESWKKHHPNVPTGNNPLDYLKVALADACCDDYSPCCMETNKNGDLVPILRCGEDAGENYSNCCNPCWCGDEYENGGSGGSTSMPSGRGGSGGSGSTTIRKKQAKKASGASGAPCIIYCDGGYLEDNCAQAAAAYDQEVLDHRDRFKSPASNRYCKGSFPLFGNLPSSICKSNKGYSDLLNRYRLNCILCCGKAKFDDKDPEQTYVKCFQNCNGGAAASIKSGLPNQLEEVVSLCCDKGVLLIPKGYKLPALPKTKYT